MRRILATVPFIFILAASACEREIDLPLKPDGGRLYLECYPAGGHDTTYIRLVAALPITDPGASGDLSGARVDFRINGRSFAPELYSADNHVYTYMVNAPLSQGDQVSVEASAEGYPSVSASSSVPPGVTGVEMRREIYDGTMLRHRFTVTRNDNSGEKHYYGIVIRGELHKETTYADAEKAPETDISYLEYDYMASSQLMPENGGPLGHETIIICDVNGMDMVVFEDDAGKTPSFEIVVDIPYEEDGYLAAGPEYSTYRRTLYNVEMFSISGLAYEYLNPRVNEALIATGLVPPFISRGNVSGGYGIASCMGCTSSGWIPAP